MGVQILVVSDGTQSSVAYVIIEAGPCDFSIAVSPSSFSAYGGTGNLAVTPSGACSWDVRTNVPWITISTSGGNGTLTISFQVLRNSGKSPRSGTIMVGVEGIEVTQAASPVTLYFAQVAVGGECTSVFTLVNRGANEFVGTLGMTGSDGQPMIVGLADRESAEEAIEASVFPISIPPNGTRILTATGLSARKDVYTGWAVLDGIGINIYGTAIFRRLENGKVASMVGFPTSTLIQAASLPAYSDPGSNRFVGFAIANPNPDAINVTLSVVDQTGFVQEVISPSSLNPLPAGQQLAIFLHQILPLWQNFRGSLLITVSGGKQAIVAGVLQNNGLLSSIPVMPVILQ